MLVRLVFWVRKNPNQRGDNRKPSRKATQKNVSKASKTLASFFFFSLPSLLCTSILNVFSIYKHVIDC